MRKWRVHRGKTGGSAAGRRGYTVGKWRSAAGSGGATCGKRSVRICDILHLICGSLHFRNCGKPCGKLELHVEIPQFLAENRVFFTVCGGKSLYFCEKAWVFRVRSGLVRHGREKAEKKQVEPQKDSAEPPPPRSAAG